MSERIEHRWAVESIEEDVARIEDDGKRMITVPLTVLPGTVTAGQVLKAVRTATSFTVELDEAGTRDVLAKSRAVMDAAMTESKHRDIGGDVSL
ncbi:MAG: hypothetical protein JWM95_5110 [Gemmatimonadetes bacterium]|nr:hypothetical protein [Gemmatimonadota bacterium]